MKIGGVIQARMGSSRLPKKMMKQVMERPILSYLIERVQRSRLMDCAIIATTANDEDQIIVDIAQEYNLTIYRGSENDVLGRIIKAAQASNLDVVVRLTGDNVLIDPALIDKSVQFFLNNRDKYDFVTNKSPHTYPCGQEVDIFPISTLDKLDELAKLPYQREHVIPYITEHKDLFRIGNVETLHNLFEGEKWDLDYPEDFEFLKKIIEKLYPIDPEFDLFDVLRLLEYEPDLRCINKKHVGVTWMTFMNYNSDTITNKNGDKHE